MLQYLVWVVQSKVVRSPAGVAGQAEAALGRRLLDITKAVTVAEATGRGGSRGGASQAGVGSGMRWLQHRRCRWGNWGWEVGHFCIGNRQGWVHAPTLLQRPSSHAPCNPH